MSATRTIELTPQYYKYVLENKYQVVIELGGRFSAKSYNEQIRLASNMASKKDYTLLVIEDLEKNMISGFYSGVKDKIEQFGHDPAYSMVKSPPLITNKINKNKALFLGYKSEQQKKAVKALDQITEIVVEEGEWLTYDDFIALLHQLRGGEPEDRKLTVLLNPVNEYCFVNQMFIESEPTKVLEYFTGTRRPKIFEKDIVTTFTHNGIEVQDTTTVLVVLSTHHDNPYLTTTQRASIEVLRTTDPEKYKQLGEARFIKSGDSYFNEFIKEIHVVEPFIIPNHWDRYTTTDYGLDMMATLWIAVDTYGNAFAYKELYESDLIISDASKRYKDINGVDTIRTKYAPPDLWNRRQETGKSAVDIFRENGVVFIKSNNDRVQGWYAVKEWLKVYDSKNEQTGEPIKTSRLKFFSNCTNIIRTLPQLIRSESNPNDVANEPHELTHAPDALRGFCTMRRSPSSVPANSVNRENTRTVVKDSPINDYINMRVR